MGLHPPLRFTCTLFFAPLHPYVFPSTPFSPSSSLSFFSSSSPLGVHAFPRGHLRNYLAHSRSDQERSNGSFIQAKSLFLLLVLNFLSHFSFSHRSCFFQLQLFHLSNFANCLVSHSAQRCIRKKIKSKANEEASGERKAY